MWDWLENLLEIMGRYGFPLVAASLFFIVMLLTIRNLWREYCRLSERHYDLLVETSRLAEQSAAESELVRQTFDAALHHLSDIRKKLGILIEELNRDQDK